MEGCTEGDLGKDNYELGITALNNDFRVRVCIKRSGRDFEHFRRDLSNRYIARSREIIFGMSEVDR